MHIEEATETNGPFPPVTFGCWDISCQLLYLAWDAGGRLRKLYMSAYAFLSNPESDSKRSNKYTTASKNPQITPDNVHWTSSHPSSIINSSFLVRKICGSSDVTQYGHEWSWLLCLVTTLRFVKARSPRPQLQLWQRTRTSGSNSFLAIYPQPWGKNETE